MAADTGERARSRGARTRDVKGEHQRQRRAGRCACGTIGAIEAARRTARGRRRPPARGGISGARLDEHGRRGWRRSAAFTPTELRPRRPGRRCDALSRNGRRGTLSSRSGRRPQTDWQQRASEQAARSKRTAAHSRAGERHARPDAGRSGQRETSLGATRVRPAVRVADASGDAKERNEGIPASSHRTG